MPTPAYRFRNTWWLAAPPARVFDAIVDLAEYPRWWPDVRAVRRLGDDTAEVVCRSNLPYRLTLLMHRTEQDERAGRMAVRLDGDLVGWLTGRVSAVGGGTTLEIAQEVDARKSLLRALSPIARPIFRGNHALMMRRGRRGLAEHLDHGGHPAVDRTSGAGRDPLP